MGRIPLSLSRAAECFMLFLRFVHQHTCEHRVAFFEFVCNNVFHLRSSCEQFFCSSNLWNFCVIRVHSLIFVMLLFL